MTPLTELKKLAELQAKATDGPWTYEPQAFIPERVWKGTKQICHVVGDSAETEATAEYIAASRNIDLPALVAYVEGLEAFAMSVIYLDSDNGLSIGARKALGRSE